MTCLIRLKFFLHVSIELRGLCLAAFALLQKITLEIDNDLLLLHKVDLFINSDTENSELIEDIEKAGTGF